MSVNTVNKLFKDSFNLSISFFDSSRGHTEGEEHDKILAFYPPNTSTNVQCSIVGLAQAVITFSNTFNQVTRAQCFFDGARTQP
jgi:hypothetical protein